MAIAADGVPRAGSGRRASRSSGRRCAAKAAYAAERLCRGPRRRAAVPRTRRSSRSSRSGCPAPADGGPRRRSSSGATWPACRCRTPTAHGRCWWPSPSGGPAAEIDGLALALEEVLRVSEDRSPDRRAAARRARARGGPPDRRGPSRTCRGRAGAPSACPALDVPEAPVPAEARPGERPALPEVAERDLVAPLHPPVPAQLRRRHRASTRSARAR